MKNILQTCLCLVFMLFLKPGEVAAQQKIDSTRLQQVEMTDGAEFIGNIISENDSSLQLLTGQYGELRIMKKDIKRITLLERGNIVRGKVWAENPQATRYLFMPNGYGLKKGEGYYQNIWVLFNQVSVGVSDRFSIGMGTFPVFLFGAGVVPVWIVPKLSIPVVHDKFNLGLGAFAGTVIGESRSGFGILYGLGTLGNRNTNMTVGLGYGYAGGSFAKSPMISLAAMVRVSPRGYLITENYYIHTGQEALALISLGGRSMLGRVGVDYGVIRPVQHGIDMNFVIPWLGLTIPFGHTYKVKPALK